MPANLPIQWQMNEIKQVTAFTFSMLNWPEKKIKEKLIQIIECQKRKEIFESDTFPTSVETYTTFKRQDSVWIFTLQHLIWSFDTD